jgi:hypothetical protein
VTTITVRSGQAYIAKDIEIVTTTSDRSFLS